ncbi:MAG TPA: DUF4349 domain-containing protein [Nocardioides sp.]|nr:DUF4349 domain-containing protein [Nocardioides sp.]
MTTNPLHRRALLPGLGLLLSLLFLIAACSGGDTAQPTSTSEAGGAAAEEAPAPAPPGAVAPQDSVERDAVSGFDAGVDTSSGTATPDVPVLQTRAVISTGTVTLQSQDVGRARFDVQKVVDAHRGEISDEQTATDTKGRVDRSRLVIRVPSQFFDEVMQDLGQVADLRSAKRTSEDVTTEVIDIDVRVRAQEKSLERIELLLARAKNLREIISIESQLTRRQAELDSLKAQQAYLADQTSLSTITVFLERTEKAAKVEKDEATGFLAGFQRGWDALGSAATVIATGLGAVLPFVVLLLLLGVPTWLLLRSLLRRRRVGPLAAE